MNVFEALVSVPAGGDDVERVGNGGTAPGGLKPGTSELDSSDGTDDVEDDDDRTFKAP